MRYLFIALFYLNFTQSSYAEDLPQNHIFNRVYEPMTIYGVSEVKIAKHEIELSTSRRGVKSGLMSAAIEIKLMVEGNLCGGDPADVSFYQQPAVDQGKNSSKLVLNSSHVLADPYDLVVNACAAFSVKTQAVVVLISQLSAKENETKTETFLIGVEEQTQDGPKLVTKRIVVTYQYGRAPSVAIENA